MSLEQAVKEFSDAFSGFLLRVLDEGKASAGASVTAAPNGEDTTPPKRGPGRPPRTAAPAVTLEMVKVAGASILDAYGRDDKGKPLPEGRTVALKLIKDHGADRLDNMDPSKYASFCAAVDVVLAQRQQPAADEDDDEI